MPYQITFRSFSPEIGGVLEGMLRSTNCMIVKSINVVSATTPLPVPAGATPAAAAPSRAQYQQYQAYSQPKVSSPEELYADRGARAAADQHDGVADTGGHSPGASEGFPVGPGD